MNKKFKILGTFIAMFSFLSYYAYFLGDVVIRPQVKVPPWALTAVSALLLFIFLSEKLKGSKQKTSPSEINKLLIVLIVISFPVAYSIANSFQELSWVIGLLASMLSSVLVSIWLIFTVINLKTYRN